MKERRITQPTAAQPGSFVLQHKACRFVTVLLLLVFFFASHAKAKSFAVYDALLHDDKPELVSQGLKTITMVYANQLWDKQENRDVPNIQRIAKVAKGLNPGSLVCVDIEHWPLTGNAQLVQESIKKYEIVASTIKKNNPTVLLGFYGALPIRDYWRAIRREGEKNHSAWIAENEMLLPMAEFVDVIFPSLYTFYTDQKGWEQYAVENLSEAHKYGKPVIAFLWPRYHDSNLSMKQFNLPADYWKLQLMTCFKHADGIVLWGGWKQKWDFHAPWWFETERFLDSLTHGNPVK